SSTDRVRDIHEHHRDRRRCFLNVDRGRSDTNQDIRLHRNKVGRHACEQLRLFVRKAVLESDVASVDVAELPESLNQRMKVWSLFYDVCGMPTDTHSRLLSYHLLRVRQGRSRNARDCSGNEPTA